MRRNLVSAAIAGCVLFLPITAAKAQDDATTRERLALSPRAANRTVQRDLLSVLEPVTQINSGMFRQLRGVGLTTRAFGTEFDGVCRRDAISLLYARTAEAGEPEDAPIRPYSIEAQPWFHIIKLPRDAPANPRAEAKIWQSKCSSIGRDAENNGWLTAKDARTAVQGALVLEAAVKEVRTGSLKSQPCPKLNDDRATSCEAAILSNGIVSDIAGIELCPAEAGSVCYIIDLASSTTLTIKARIDEDAMVPSSVFFIAIEQYIVVT